MTDRMVSLLVLSCERINKLIVVHHVYAHLIFNSAKACVLILRNAPASMPQQEMGRMSQTPK